VPALAASALITGSARGQRPVQVVVEVGAAAARVRSAIGTLTEPLDGIAIVVGAGVSVRGLGLEARYAEAKLESTNAGVERRDLADGEIFLSVNPHRLVSLKAGPHARAYRSDSGTRRWVFWEARVRGTAPIVPSRLDAYAELWAAMAGSTSLSTGFQGARGGEVGAVLDLPGMPLGLGVAYRIDRGRGDNPSRVDTAEQVVLKARARLR
jgi:hypothetical protein